MLLEVLGNSCMYSKKTEIKEGVECPLKNKKKCANQNDGWLTQKASRKKEKRKVREANIFLGHLNIVLVKVNLSQHTGPFDKGIPNTERFVGVIANGLKVFRSMKEISYCKSAYWLTTERQWTEKYIQLLNWHSDFTYQPCKPV